MTHAVMRIRGRASLAALSLALTVVFGAAYTLSAQAPAKKALTVEDYTKWRSISGSELSGDGAWIAYVVQLTNTATTDTKPVLHIVNLETNADVTVANATAPAFSSDSRWIAYQIDPGAGRGGRGGRGGGGGGAAPGGGDPPAGGATPPSTTPAATPPATPAGGQGATPAGGSTAQAGRGTTPATPPRRVELRKLATGTVQTWQDIQSFTFSATRRTCSSGGVRRRRARPVVAGRMRRRAAVAEVPAPAAGAGARR